MRRRKVRWQPGWGQTPEVEKKGLKLTARVGSKKLLWEDVYVVVKCRPVLCGVKGRGSAPDFLGFESWLCCFPCFLYSCASYPASLCLGFIVHQVGLIAVTRAAALKLEYEHTSAC